jgi:hypothetical protein
MADIPSMYDLMKDEPMWTDKVENRRYSATGVYVPFIYPSRYLSLADFDWQSTDNPVDLARHSDFLYCGDVMRGFEFDPSAPGKDTWKVSEFLNLGNQFKANNWTSEPSDDDILIRTDKPWVNPITAIVKAIFNTTLESYPKSGYSKIFFSQMIAINPTVVTAPFEEDVSMSANFIISMRVRYDGHNDILIDKITIGQKIRRNGWEGEGMENIFFSNTELHAQYSSDSSPVLTSVASFYSPSDYSFDEGIEKELPLRALMPAFASSSGWRVEGEGDSFPLIDELNRIMPADKFNEQLSYFMSNIILHEEEK